MSLICCGYLLHTNTLQVSCKSGKQFQVYRVLNKKLIQLAQVKNKSINKYQCGNDLDFSPPLKNADKYASARFDDPNRKWLILYKPC